MAKGGKRGGKKSGGRKRSLASLSPKYRQRIERGLAKGKSRQEARGHRPGEAAERREREREEIGVASSDRKAIQNFLRRFNPVGFKALPTEEDLTDWVRENGYEQFQIYRVTWDAARRAYLREQANGTYASRGMGYLEGLTEAAGVEDVQWLYYH